MKKRLSHFAGLFLLLLLPFLLCACGYSREEKEHMKEIETLGEENARNYILEKYGFSPEVTNTRVCKEDQDGDFFPPASGNVLVSMRHEDKDFLVFINGEKETLEGTDDFQHEMIAEEAKQYFEALLGYRVYDVYLEYKENRISGDPYLDRQEDNLISERYEPGSFDAFLRRHPASIGIYDCLDQDITRLPETNPAAADFFIKYGADCQMKAVLISYRSEDDYHGSYYHTYGKYRIPAFEIWKDGLFIHSYAAFDEDGIETERFSFQEYDGIYVSYFVRADDDLTVTGGQAEWMELGKTKGDPLSKVYSVKTDSTGEVTVYIPKEKLSEYGRNPSVFIQHFYEDGWGQYDPVLLTSTDGSYVFFTFYGIHGSSFDFAVFR